MLYFCHFFMISVWLFHRSQPCRRMTFVQYLQRQSTTVLHQWLPPQTVQNLDGFWLLWLLQNTPLPSHEKSIYLTIQTWFRFYFIVYIIVSVCIFFLDALCLIMIFKKIRFSLASVARQNNSGNFNCVLNCQDRAAMGSLAICSYLFTFLPKQKSKNMILISNSLDWGFSLLKKILHSWCKLKLRKF